MEKRLISVKTLAAVVIGAVLMFVLNRFAAIPTGVPKTYLYPGVAILSLFAAIFGPLVGLLIGFIGHALVDLTRPDNVSWTWVIASTLYGLTTGLFWKIYRIEEGEFEVKQALVFNGVQIAANILAWVIVAPTLDILVGREHPDKVYLQGLVAASLNAAVVLILGTLLAFGYSKTRAKAASQKAE